MDFQIIALLGSILCFAIILNQRDTDILREEVRTRPILTSLSDKILKCRLAWKYVLTNNDFSWSYVVFKNNCTEVECTDTLLQILLSTDLTLYVV
jgi:hypothetical protein